MQDIRGLCERQVLSPDLLFFTGDLAYGNLKDDPITNQFDIGQQLIRRLMDSVPKEIPLSRVFLVPGNHDVNRDNSTVMEQDWLFTQAKLEKIQEMMLANKLSWQRYTSRLKEYREFLFRHGYSHLLGEDVTSTFSATVDTDSASVGIAGLNSAWPCAGDVPRTGQHGLLTCARFQIERQWPRIESADCRIALIHHPKAWFGEAERNDVWDNMIHARFHFSLHGHEHEDNFADMRNHKSIAAGSWYEHGSKRNSYNICRLDLDERKGLIWFRQYITQDGGGWVPMSRVHSLPELEGAVPFDLPVSMTSTPRKFVPVPNTLGLVASQHPRPTAVGGNRPRPKLVVFDLDGTLLQIRGSQYSWASIWADLGYSGQLRRTGYKMYEQRIINYKQWCEYCRNFFRLKKLTRDRLNDIARKYCSLRPGVLEMLEQLKTLNYRMAVVSGGLDVFLDTCIPDHSKFFSKVYINRTTYDIDGVIQDISPTNYDFDGKRTAVQDLAREFAISTEDVAFVGDARNDLSVSGHVGRVIAFGGEQSELAHVADFVARDVSALFKHITGQVLQWNGDGGQHVGIARK